MSDQKYRVKIKKHQQRAEQALLDAVQEITQIGERLEKAGVDTDSIVNLFSQAYAVAGLRYEVEPDQLVALLSTNGLALNLLNKNPSMKPEELAEVVESIINDDEDEPVFDRSSPDPDMPMFLAPGLGEA